MINDTHISNFFTVLFFICLNSCLLKKPRTDISNHTNYSNKSEIPLISFCKNDNTKACLLNSINDLILSEVEKNGLKTKKDTIRVGLRFNIDGTISILKNDSNNS